MPWSNPLVAGTTLIRTAIKSPNYVAGVSGWSINKDGSAEFNSVTVRGTLYVQGPNGDYIKAYNDAVRAVIEFQPPDVNGYTYTPGHIDAEAGVANAPIITIKGPSQTAPVAVTGGQIQVGVDGTNNVSIASINANEVNLGQTAAGTTEILSPSTQIDGVLTAANRIVGNVTIVPVANTPTSAVITFPATLKGSSFTCQVSPNTTVPGTQVLGVSYTALSNIGVTIWITRTNTNSTTVSYTVEGF